MPTAQFDLMGIVLMSASMNKHKYQPDALRTILPHLIFPILQISSIKTFK